MDENTKAQIFVGTTTAFLTLSVLTENLLAIIICIVSLMFSLSLYYKKSGIEKRLKTHKKFAKAKLQKVLEEE